jgi:hypothetical protein
MMPWLPVHPQGKCLVPVVEVSGFYSPGQSVGSSRSSQNSMTVAVLRGGMAGCLTPDSTLMLLFGVVAVSPGAGPSQLPSQKAATTNDWPTISVNQMRTLVRERQEKDAKIGGPGRIRTSNQTVMSAVTSSEVSIKSDVFRHANQRVFTFGCGQSLAKHWFAGDIGVGRSFATSTRACVEEALGRDRNAFHRRRCASAITRVLVRKLPIARPWPFLPPGFPALRSQMSPLITPPSQAFS